MFNQLLVRKLVLYSSSNTCLRAFSCISGYQLPHKHQALKALPQSLTQTRSFWESFPYPRPSLHVKDRLDKEKYELVYRSQVFNYVFYGQLFSFFGFALPAVLGSKYLYQLFVTGEVASFSVPTDLLHLLIILSFVAQNSCVFLAAQKALLRVYYSEEKNKYVFVTLSTNPFKSRLTFCKPGELKCLKTGLLSFIVGNHEIKGRRFFINKESFKSNYFYNEATGYRNE